VIVFPNCKINLGLHILQKRPDGFHDLETVFYPVEWRDGLEIIQQQNANLPTIFTSSGHLIEGPAENNTCLKAYYLLKKDFPNLPSVQIHLHKTIPTGAGLGGGSADGAFTLLLLNQKFNLGLTEEQLIHYALVLGSDCPFFIKNKPCYATGRGEIMEEVRVDLSGYLLAVINPGIHVNTGWAFSQLKLSGGKPSLKEIISFPVNQWKERLINDFEAPVFSQHPEIQAIKEDLYHNGAVYASMSGSGSTVYGLFEKGATPQFSYPSTYAAKVI
jgi:4-diphosphocytidyl-2-C-methyl-D-erythritol kinase